MDGSCTPSRSRGWIRGECAGVARGVWSGVGLSELLNVGDDGAVDDGEFGRDFLDRCHGSESSLPDMGVIRCSPAKMWPCNPWWWCGGCRCCGCGCWKWLEWVFPCEESDVPDENP